jgi:hypothetical protein
MKLDDRKREILKSVGGGKLEFQPKDGSDAARARFQPIAQSIIELESLNYLEGVSTTKENETGEDYIDLVLVGGLTAKSRRYLESIGFKLPAGEGKGDVK